MDLSQADSKDAIVDAYEPEGNAHFVKPLPTPPSMTLAERAQHNITHLPPHRGCPICAANRTPNTAHSPSHEHERTIPLLVVNYCFLRSIHDILGKHEFKNSFPRVRFDNGNPRSEAVGR